MTTAKNVFFIELLLENCYSFVGGGGGGGGRGGGDRLLVEWIKLWWEEGEILVGDMSKFLAGWGDSPHPLSRKNSVLITFSPESF